MSVIWHDLECGRYTEDLALWRSLASEHGDPVLDIGAGTGRVALELARAGHSVTALEQDPVLLAELARRARGLDLEAVLGDARSFALQRRFALCLVPMLTIQLLGGHTGRIDFLECAVRHLLPGGLLAVALAVTFELYEAPERSSSPRPDTCELDGVLYSSRPTAVRADGAGFVLERRRETILSTGRRCEQDDVIHLDGLCAAELEREALSVGMTLAMRASVPANRDYAGSVVVMLSA